MTRININEIEEPYHYSRGEKDAIDFVKSIGRLEGFCVGNIIKYLYRYQFKEDAVADLLKARAYLAVLIDHIKEKGISVLDG